MSNLIKRLIKNAAAFCILSLTSGIVFGIDSAEFKDESSIFSLKIIIIYIILIIILAWRFFVLRNSKYKLPCNEHIKIESSFKISYRTMAHVIIVNEEKILVIENGASIAIHALDKTVNRA